MKDPVKARNVKDVGLERRVIGIGEEPTFEWRMKAPVDSRNWIDNDRR
jgi:hypothetical protein